MANYRIKVERLNDDVPLSEELENGIEVNGFTFLGDVDEEHTLVVVQHMSVKDIAIAMNGEQIFLDAAKLCDIINLIGGSHE